MIQIIYTSAATREFSQDELANLLRQSRQHNAQVGITGILLHSQGSFFQVLEGDEKVIDALVEHIAHDPRHTNLTVIIREPISHRSFGDWTMGFAVIEPQEVSLITGMNDFFGNAAFFANIDSGRAKKLLEAFNEGRWRSKLTSILRDTGMRQEKCVEPVASVSSHASISFAFQPIVNALSQRVIAYEALLRGIRNEPALQVFNRVQADEMHLFDQDCRSTAIELAARLGLDVRLHLNFLPLSLSTLESSIFSTLEAASHNGMRPEQIVLEIVESEIILDLDHFILAINAHRGTGLSIAIDDFGAGYAGLTLLADFQPEIVKLDMKLARGIDSKGPRQAIVRGILRTCRDLGIDIIAEGVETTAEYAWFIDEGVEIFQGNLFARAAFEQFPPVFYPEQ
jgi:EAL domain-containing protein (putative c-di-GMP-specific phosphodiesterase class I)